MFGNGMLTAMVQCWNTKVNAVLNVKDYNNLMKEAGLHNS